VVNGIKSTKVVVDIILAMAFHQLYILAGGEYRSENN